jgi:hypothetical protein
MRLGMLLFLASSLAIAEQWSGVLVNTPCYDNLENSAGPINSGIDVYKDRNYEVRYCRADGKTKSFTLVQSDGRSYKLDESGNTKAAEIVRGGKQKNIFVVEVNGELMDRLITVESMKLLRNPRP